jgi:hypothetical protein
MFTQIYQQAQQQFPNDRVKQLEFLATELAKAGKVVEAEKARAMAQKAKEEMLSQASAAPSAVREYEFFKTLSPDDQKVYQSLKRQTNSIKDLGNELALVDNATGQIIQRFPKGLAPQDQPAVKGAQKEATKTAVSDVDILNNAPTQLDTYENIISKVEDLSNHPGLKIATGGSSLLPLVPGSDAYNFNALLESVKGAAFLEQFEKLKGGGQITQIEGEKATAALAALDRAQSEKQFKEQLKIVVDIMKKGQDKLKKKFEKAQQSSASRKQAVEGASSSGERVVNWSDLPSGG